MLTITQQKLQNLYFKDMIMSEEAVPKMIELTQEENIAKAIENAHKPFLSYKEIMLWL